MDEMTSANILPHGNSAATGSCSRDPVCGMTVEPETENPRYEHVGRVIHFCSPRCREKFAAAPNDYLTAADPVCGMEVDKPTADFMTKHDGRRVYFCSQRCQTEFETQPEAFTAALPARKSADTPVGTRWICPMDPEIDEDGPGDYVQWTPMELAYLHDWNVILVCWACGN